MYSRPAEPKPPKKTETGGQVRGVVERTHAICQHLPIARGWPRLEAVPRLKAAALSLIWRLAARPGKVPVKFR